MKVFIRSALDRYSKDRYIKAILNDMSKPYNDTVFITKKLITIDSLDDLEEIWIGAKTFYFKNDIKLDVPLSLQISYDDTPEILIYDSYIE